MGQQMTPDTAKIKCKNFLATLLRLASDQPESVARNVRSLIQVNKIFVRFCINNLLSRSSITLLFWKNFNFDLKTSS